MRVVICGAGQVGYGIAAYLSRENNDITLIDNDPRAVNKASGSLDVNVIHGHASNPDVLAAAGAAEADMLIAVTYHDEVNMVACQVAHSLFNVPRKIARIRESSYRDPSWSNLFSRAHMPIDVIIYPEHEVASAVMDRLTIPGTTNVLKLADEKLYLCGVMCTEDTPLINTPLEQLTTLFPDAKARIVTIFRGNEVIIPKKDEQMLPGDEVYFIIEKHLIDRAISAFGKDSKKARRLVILGGGKIGLALIRLLQSQNPEIELKVIENNTGRATYLSQILEDVVVINGSGVERDILSEANIQHAESIVSITNNDESNILASLLAKQYGCERAITLVNKTTYNLLFGALSLGAVVSPKMITLSTIMKHVRRGRIKEVHSLGDDDIEVIEAEASENCSIINTPLKDLKLPKDSMVAAIVHGEQIVYPEPKTSIRAGDRVIFVARQGQAHKVEQLFSVQVSL
jgi:trk system potassium uptake protein TrkA